MFGVLDIIYLIIVCNALTPEGWGASADSGFARTAE
jgi:hypothetical protein